MSTMSSQDQSTSSPSRSRNRSRGQGRGRGGRRPAKSRSQTAENDQLNQDFRSAAIDGESLDPDAPTCPICTEVVEYYALGPCDHRVCFKCCLRMRVLLKSEECLLCKAKQDSIAIAKDEGKPFIELGPDSEFESHDEGLNAYFDSREAYDAAMRLLGFTCPLRSCSFSVKSAVPGWQDLKNHARKVHHMEFCDICVKNKKAFPIEQFLYTQNTLHIHINRGDRYIKNMMPTHSAHTAKIQAKEGGQIHSASSAHVMRGHPQCKFCKIRFYEDDDLFEHCRHNHEECFLCQRQGIRNVYYNNYLALEEHFKNQHFACDQPSCLEKKFVVFASALDLKAHMLEEHSKGFKSKKPVDRKVDVFATRQNGGSATSGDSGWHASGSTARPSTSQVSEPGSSRNDATAQLRRRAAQAGFGSQLSSPPGAETAQGAQASSLGESQPSPLLQRLWDFVGKDKERMRRSREMTQRFIKGQVGAYAYWEELSSLYLPDADALVSRAALLDVEARSSSSPYKPAWGSQSLASMASNSNPGLSALEKAGLVGMIIQTCPPGERQAALKKGYQDFKVKTEHYPELPTAGPSHARHDSAPEKNRKSLVQGTRGGSSQGTFARVVPQKSNNRANSALTSRLRQERSQVLDDDPPPLSGNFWPQLDSTTASAFRKQGLPTVAPPEVQSDHRKVVVAPATGRPPPNVTNMSSTRPTNAKKGGRLNNDEFPSLGPTVPPTAIPAGPSSWGSNSSQQIQVRNQGSGAKRKKGKAKIVLM